MHILIEDNFLEHPKVWALREKVGPEAEVYLIRLWIFALRFARSGVLASPDLIEPRVGWRGEPGALLQALKEVGFLEADSVTIHDWHHHSGRWLRYYEDRKARARETRKQYRQAKASLYEAVRAELVEKQPPPPPTPPTHPRAPEPIPHGAGPVDLTSHEDQTLYRLFQQARRVVQGREDTIRSYVEKWVSSRGAAYVEEVLMNPIIRGQSVVWIQNGFFEAPQISKKNRSGKDAILETLKGLPRAGGGGVDGPCDGSL
jgi:hypothetical protein